MMIVNKAYYINPILLVFVIHSIGLAKTDECRYEIVESMPEGLDLPQPNPNFRPAATHEALIEMIEKSNRTLRIASFYWFLSAEEQFDNNTAVEPGKHIQEAISKAVARGVNLEVVLDNSSQHDMNNEKDIEQLNRWGTVKHLNMTRLLKAGVLHSKFLIADNRTFYIGSSNFDWRSYSEIKEMGFSIHNCPQLAQDLDKIFRTYFLMADEEHVPKLSDEFKTRINLEHPLSLHMDNQDAHLFLAGSPPSFNGAHDDWTGRTDDIDALLHIINSAQHRVSISVMNYSPQVTFGWPKRYWPLIDDALRRAATERNVRVELLFSNWTQTKPLDLIWYKSLDALHSKLFHGGGVHVKLFKVPSFNEFQHSIPFARVKHDKYMVTDNGLYIGTSNWQPDYFINTCGVSVVIQPKKENNDDSRASLTVIKNMQDLFDRDFQSLYAHDLHQI